MPKNQSQYNPEQCRIRLSFLSCLLNRWLLTAELPSQFVNKPDTAYMIHSMGSVVRWECLRDTSKSLVVTRDFWEKFLKKMNKDLNMLIPCVLKDWASELDKLEENFVNMQSELYKTETGLFSKSVDVNTNKNRQLRSRMMKNLQRQCEIKAMIPLSKIFIVSISWQDDCLFLDFFC